MPAKGQSDYDAGYVYIAVSHTLGPGTYKVGLSRHPFTRRDQLNAEAYFGVQDWWIAEYRPVSSMLAVEDKLHECFGRPIKIEGCTEIEVFSVPYPKAVNYLNYFAELFVPRHPVGSLY